MIRFFSLAIVLFLLLAGGLAWVTGDKRPFTLAYWQSMWATPGTTTTTTAGVTKSNIGATSPNSGERKSAPPATGAPKTTTQSDASVATVKVAAIGTPDGRYVSAPATGASSKQAAPAAELVRVGSPAGGYVDAQTATTTTTVAAVDTSKISRTGSPDGRYVDAPRMMTVKTVDTSRVPRVSSPAGRYVDAPKASAPPPAATAQLVRVGSPAGRYVDAPKKAAAAAPAAAATTQLMRVGSPAGRYVDAPQTASAPPPAAPREITRIGSPAGRYVDRPKTAAKPRVSRSGALVFPITFAYRTSDFTSTGRDAADALLAHILKKKYSTITLTGHTDSRGSDSVNMRVSKKRLDAVSAHLRAGGYKGKINLEPKGKSQPYDGVDRSKYSQEQLYDLDRRVELKAGS